MKLRRWRFHLLLLPVAPVMADGYLRVLGFPGFLPWPQSDGAEVVRAMLAMIGPAAALGLTILALDRRIDL